MNALPFGVMDPPFAPAGSAGSEPASAWVNVAGNADPTVHCASASGLWTSSGVADTNSWLALVVIVVRTVPEASRTWTPSAVLAPRTASHTRKPTSLSPAFRMLGVVALPDDFFSDHETRAEPVEHDGRAGARAIRSRAAGEGQALLLPRVGSVPMARVGDRHRVRRGRRGEAQCGERSRQPSDGPSHIRLRQGTFTSPVRLPVERPAARDCARARSPRSGRHGPRERRVGAALGDAAVLEHDDLIGGDFIDGVQGRGGLVEDHDRGVLEQRAIRRAAVVLLAPDGHRHRDRGARPAVGGNAEPADRCVGALRGIRVYERRPRATERTMNGDWRLSCPSLGCPKCPPPPPLAASLAALGPRRRDRRRPRLPDGDRVDRPGRPDRGHAPAEPRDDRLQLGDDRLPRGAGGRADLRRGDRQLPGANATRRRPVVPARRVRSAPRSSRGSSSRRSSTPPRRSARGWRRSPASSRSSCCCSS